MLVGIDPGAKGGIAMLTREGKWIAGYRTPVIKWGARTIIDVEKISQLIDGETENHGWPISMTMEFVTSFGQGRTSAFNFGRYVGCMEAVCQFYGLEPNMVTPQEWKKGWNLSKDKREAMNLAGVKFPEATINWSVLANDGIAEAALMALYNLRKRCIAA